MRERDVVARIIGTGAVVIAGAAVVKELLTKPVQPPVESTPAADVQDELNLIGDCVNENVIRKAFGAPPIDLEGCQEEREYWATQLAPTPVPGKDG